MSVYAAIRLYKIIMWTMFTVHENFYRRLTVASSNLFSMCTLNFTVEYAFFAKRLICDAHPAITCRKISNPQRDGDIAKADTEHGQVHRVAAPLPGGAVDGDCQFPIRARGQDGNNQFRQYSMVKRDLPGEHLQAPVFCRKIPFCQAFLTQCRSALPAGMR